MPDHEPRPDETEFARRRVVGAADPIAATPTDVYDQAGQPISRIEPASDAERRLMLDGEHTIELREEQLVSQKDMREVGEVTIRTEIDEVPGRLEVEALREEVEVEHVPVGQVVSQREQPWEDGDTLVVPVYDEQLVVVKRLYLREHLRIRRISTRERQVFEDTLRKERLVVEDPANSGLVREQYSREGPAEGTDVSPEPGRAAAVTRERGEGGFFENLVKKALN